jgi:hypothetical protein
MQGAILFVCASGLCQGEESAINLETANFPAPDGKHVLKFEQREDGWTYFDVENLKTAQLESSAKIELTPLYSVHWSPDCGTIVTVGHIAHGTTATLFHFDNGQWRYWHLSPSSQYDFDPHLIRVGFKVVNVKVTDDAATIFYDLIADMTSETGQPESKKSVLTLSVSTKTAEVLKSKETLEK